MSTVIQVDSLWKKYRLGVLGTGTLRHDFNRWWHRVRGKADPYAKIGQHGGEITTRRDQSHGPMTPGPVSPGGPPLGDDEVWALRGVSFEVRQGEILGIIGRNGAGKSTLLKILSRVTAPASGEVRVKGRIASLLEVGTGFHPELTGRENIFLNGAILGMTKAEIRKKLDEIITFAGIEKFLDTPVKRYSSGMYVRLAFAVAAHLEPEILVVDEVLAVGDAEFQKKCLGKMQDVSRIGRTVLFVSHDMNNITRLCRNGLLLNQGQVEAHGEITAVVAEYLQEGVSEDGYADLSKRGDRSGSGNALFESVELLRFSGRASTFAFHDSMTLRAAVKVKAPIGSARVVFIILTSDGIPVHGLENLNEGLQWRPEPGFYLFDVTVPQVELFPGRYVVDLWVSDEQRARVDYLRGAISFGVVQTPDTNLGAPLERSNGLVFARSHWKCEKSNDHSS